MYKSLLRNIVNTIRKKTFILVSVQVYHRILTFETVMIKCKDSLDKEPCFAKNVSKIATEQVRKAHYTDAVDYARTKYM